MIVTDAPLPVAPLPVAPLPVAPLPVAPLKRQPFACCLLPRRGKGLSLQRGNRQRGNRQRVTMQKKSKVVKKVPRRF